ncbi:MAG: YgjV family protein [Oscillospiraceae bacterium]|nr:YgjV family protein [Oscillospiraceae bacterium]
MTIEFRFDDPVWIVSQVFAFFALVFLVWSFQMKNKIVIMLLMGLGSAFLGLSAICLGNYSVGMLFWLTAVWNFVFTYLDWRISRGKRVHPKLKYIFAGIFAILTITATSFLWTLGMALWLEIMICVTLLGLILGSVLKGTNIMRVSFITNRVFNIINHIHFNNPIGVIIASTAIGSNVVFYIRQMIAKNNAE